MDLTPDEIAKCHEVAAMAIQQHCIDVGELERQRDACLAVCRRMAQYPICSCDETKQYPNCLRCAARAAIALCEPAPDLDPTVIVKGSEIAAALEQAERECFEADES